MMVEDDAIKLSHMLFLNRNCYLLYDKQNIDPGSVMLFGLFVEFSLLDK